MVNNNFQNIQFYLNNYIINSQKLIALNKFSDQYFANQLANKLDNHYKNLTKVEKSITNIAIQNINEKEKQLKYLDNLLNNSSYRKLLSRGFAILTNQDNKVISSIESLKSTKFINVELSDGKIILKE